MQQRRIEITLTTDEGVARIDVRDLATGSFLLQRSARRFAQLGPDLGDCIMVALREAQSDR